MHIPQQLHTVQIVDPKLLVQIVSAEQLLNRYWYILLLLHTRRYMSYHKLPSTC